MAGAIAHDKASQLRDAVDEALCAAPEINDSARAAFARLIDVLESSDDAVVFPGRGDDLHEPGGRAARRQSNDRGAAG